MKLAALTVLLVSLLATPAAQAHDRTLERYARDTWRSFELISDSTTGLPSDNASPGGERAAYTSPTNIAAYLWSTVAARDVHVIGRREAHARLSRTLRTLSRLERGPRGQFFNCTTPRPANA